MQPAEIGAFANCRLVHCSKFFSIQSSRRQ
jgi:hypothetical protein